MNQYHELLIRILRDGTYKEAARENMPGTTSLFGYQNRYDLSQGFPLITTKKMHYRGIISELFWFMKGRTDLKYLLDNNCKVWIDDAYRYFKELFPESNATKEEFLERVNAGYQRKNSEYRYGDLGPVYGKQWRDFGGQDQLINVIQSLRQNPMGRRHIINAWNASELDQMALEPCHVLAQFNVRIVNNIYTLDCQLYQRSADTFLGIPFNIASYALFTEIIARFCGYKPGEFIHTFGDVHIYDNHLDVVEEQLHRNPCKYKLPQLNLVGLDELAMSEFDVEQMSDLSIEQVKTFIDIMEPGMVSIDGYESYPAIKAPLSVGL